MTDIDDHDDFRSTQLARSSLEKLRPFVEVTYAGPGTAAVCIAVAGVVTFVFAERRVGRCFGVVGHDGESGRLLLHDERQESEGTEVVLFRTWVGWTGGRHSFREQGGDHGLEVAVQHDTAQRVESARQPEHAGSFVGPGVQSGVAALLGEAGHAVVVFECPCGSVEGAGEVVGCGIRGGRFLDQGR